MSDQVHGVLAEFETPDELLKAVEKIRDAGYTRLDAYTPYPIEELTEALGVKHTKLGLIVFMGAVLGGVGGYLMQWYSSVYGYPLNVGGRPQHAWPAFMPVTFELTILMAALFAVLGMLALNGLPMPYHPVFNVPEFERASQDRFFLCVHQDDPNFELEKTTEALAALSPQGIYPVNP